MVVDGVESPQTDELLLSENKIRTSENPSETLLDKDDKLNFGVNKCNDSTFAILFYAQILGIIVLASANAHKIDWKGNDSNTEYMAIFGLTIATGLLGAWIYLNILRSNAKLAIQVAVILNIVLIWIVFIYSLIVGNWVFAFFWGFLALASVYYWWYIQDRIPFTVALIEIGIRIIDQNSPILCAAAATILLQAAFIGIWALAFLGYGETTKEEGSDSWNLSLGYLSMFVLAAFWTFETIRYVLYTTAAGVTASWFFTPDKPNATAGAFKRAAWYSFGSIAFGGLLIAIVKTMEFVARYAQSQSNGDSVVCQIIVCCVICMLSCLEDILEFLNEFGFAFVAIYGITYCAACRKVWDLIKETGFESIFQYDLTGLAIFLGCFLTGLLTFLIVFAYAKWGGSDTVKDNSLVIGVIGLVVSFGIAYVTMMIIVAAVTTTFVVWALDPRTLFVNRPEEANQLVKATESLPAISLDRRHLNPEVDSNAMNV